MLAAVVERAARKVERRKEGSEKYQQQSCGGNNETVFGVEEKGEIESMKKECHRMRHSFRLTKRDDYFRVTFHHFGNKHHF